MYTINWQWTTQMTTVNGQWTGLMDNEHTNDHS